PGRPARGGLAAVSPRLASHGTAVEASADGSTLLVTATALRPTDRETLADPDMRRLLLAHLTGSPLRCSFDHPGEDDPPEAATIAVGGAPVCRGHLRGE